MADLVRRGVVDEGGWEWVGAAVVVVSVGFPAVQLCDRQCWLRGACSDVRGSDVEFCGGRDAVADIGGWCLPFPCMGFYECLSARVAWI